jgi:hypothetical protein
MGVGIEAINGLMKSMNDVATMMESLMGDEHD